MRKSLVLKCFISILSLPMASPASPELYGEKKIVSQFRDWSHAAEISRCLVFAFSETVRKLIATCFDPTNFPHGAKIYCSCFRKDELLSSLSPTDIC